MPLNQDNFQCGLDCTDTKVLLVCFIPLYDYIEFQEYCFNNLCIKPLWKTGKQA